MEIIAMEIHIAIRLIMIALLVAFCRCGSGRWAALDRSPTTILF